MARRKSDHQKYNNSMDQDDDYDVIDEEVSRKKRGVISRFFRFLFLLIFLVFIWCMYCYYIIIFQKDDKPLQHADAAIVLGAALWNNVPSPALKERLDEAIEIYNEGLVDYLILSGGRGTQESKLSEAEGMRNYLVNAGVPEEQLILEMHSTDTYENILFSEKMMELHQLDSVIIISHAYHGLRAGDIAQYVNIDQVQIDGVQTKVLNKAYHYTREVLAYTKWQMNKLLLHIGLYI